MKLLIFPWDDISRWQLATVFAANTECYSGEDCGVDECCARPMLSSSSYCMPLKARGEVCDSTPYILDFVNQVQYDSKQIQLYITDVNIFSVQRNIKFKPKIIQFSKSQLIIISIFWE